MVWQIYTGRGSKGEFSFPVVTVHRSGTIVLSERAYDALGQPRTLDILYDETQPMKMGIRGNPEGAYTPRKVSNGKGWLISGSSFLRFIGHQPTETLRFRPPPVTEGVLEIDLAAPMPKSPRSTKRKKEDAASE